MITIANTYVHPYESHIYIRYVFVEFKLYKPHAIPLAVLIYSSCKCSWSIGFETAHCAQIATTLMHTCVCDAVRLFVLVYMVVRIWVVHMVVHTPSIGIPISAQTLVSWRHAALRPVRGFRRLRIVSRTYYVCICVCVYDVQHRRGFADGAYSSCHVFGAYTIYTCMFVLCAISSWAAQPWPRTNGGAHP